MPFVLRYLDNGGCKVSWKKYCLPNFTANFCLAQGDGIGMPSASGKGGQLHLLPPRGKDGQRYCLTIGEELCLELIGMRGKRKAR